MNNSPEITYEKFPFDAILSKDTRYDSRAYDFVLDVVKQANEEAERHISGRELLEHFRSLALDAFGPMTFTVLTDWGLHNCMDIGNVVMNLADAGLIGKAPGDSAADFIGGFDFKTEFIDPFAV